MFLTYHAKLRYIQRVLRMENEDLARAYLSRNKEKVTYEIYGMIEKSVLFIENYCQQGSGASSSIYLHSDKYLIVMDNVSKKIVTIIEIGLPKAERTRLIRNINNNMRNIRRLEQEKAIKDKTSRKYEHKVEALEEILDDLNKKLQASVESGKETTIKIRDLKHLNRMTINRMTMFGKKIERELTTIEEEEYV